MPEFDDARYLDEATHATDRFAALLATVDPGAPVPTCPGWRVSDLAGHVASIHDWVTRIVDSGRSQRQTDLEPPDESVALAEWYRTYATAMLAVLGTTDPDRDCWNFAGVDQRVGFWPRRQLHEVSMHTVDLAAVGEVPLVIAADIAADGLDEVLTVFAVRMAARGVTVDLPTAITLAPDDVEVAWTVHPASGPKQPPAVTRTEAADTRISGPASDLLMTVWKRRPIDELVISGDRALAEAYLRSQLTP